MVPAVLHPAGQPLTVRASADAFLSSLENPTTVQNYGAGINKIAESLGEGQSMASVTGEEIAEAFELLWASSSVNTWNTRHTAVASWLRWCRVCGHDAPVMPDRLRRRTAPDAETPARRKAGVTRPVFHREVGLPEKTVSWMLYEAAARAEQLLERKTVEWDAVRQLCRWELDRIARHVREELEVFSQRCVELAARITSADLLAPELLLPSAPKLEELAAQLNRGSVDLSVELSHPHPEAVHLAVLADQITITALRRRVHCACPGCDQELEHSATGRPRRYCRMLCRKRAQRL